MTHRELVHHMASECGTQTMARRVLDAVSRVLARGLVEDGQVRVPGLGRLSVVEIPPNEVTSGITGDKMMLPARHRVALKLSAEAKQMFREVQGAATPSRSCFGKFDAGDVDCLRLCPLRAQCRSSSDRP